MKKIFVFIFGVMVFFGEAGADPSHPKLSQSDLAKISSLGRTPTTVCTQRRIVRSKLIGPSNSRTSGSSLGTSGK